MSIKEKFLRYVAIDTMSDEGSETYPSTSTQLEFGKLLVKELHELGVTNAYQDEFGNIYASIDGDSSIPKIGLIAHMDTSPSLQGGNYQPRIIKNYQGEDIKLCDEYTLSKKEFPSLNNNIGHDLIVTDGYHLLGGDDKAGIAIIMQIAEYYINHKEIKHSPIRICFTPDEEIGLGSLHFDVNKMDADFAYTLDGGEYNDVNYENFNAASCVVRINGVGVHPGSAKGIMINAITLGMEFNSLLPQNEVPEHTEGYEGFYHLTDFNGNIETVTMHYILRDHDYNKLLQKKDKMNEIKNELQNKYPKSKIEVTLKHSYKNMYEYFKNDMSVIHRIEKAYKANNLPIKFSPIRGGTDGASITFKGLPCPNIGVGDYNCHGRYEYVSINEMETVFNVIKALLENK